MKKLLGLCLVSVLCLSFIGCTADVADKEETYTENIKKQSLDAVGLPTVKNFFEMGQLKDIYEDRDNPNLVCHWYTVNQYTGKLIYKGTCVGYGIPYGTQITSPEVYEYEGVTIPQAEPNGLYTTSNTTATWVLSVNAKGDIEPAYVEQQIEVYKTKRPAYECEEWSLPSDY